MIPKERVMQLVQAALEAVDPARAVRTTVRREGDERYEAPLVGTRVPLDGKPPVADYSKIRARLAIRIINFLHLRRGPGTPIIAGSRAHGHWVLASDVIWSREKGEDT